VPGSGAADRQGVDRLERLQELGRALTSELDLRTVLEQVLETARALTGARYAALGVLDDRRHGLAQFLTAGVSEEVREAIGEPPGGHGVLGVLIDRPEPIRVHDVSQHPRSYGFPAGHPPMRAFLGVPITIRGERWGNLYLTEKAGADDFDDDDLDTIVVLSEWAAVAIDNARLSAEATAHREDLERALRASRSAMEVVTAVGTDTDLPRILELIVKRARALVEADSLLIWLLRDDRLEIAAVTGNANVPADASIPLDTSTAGAALRGSSSARVEDLQRMGVNPSRYGLSSASSTLIVPLVHRGRGLGVLMAFDHLGPRPRFDADDQRALEAFAASAAIAVATARSVEEQRLHDTMAAAEAERRRWARELHDETLQGLAALKLSLIAALKAEPGHGRPLLETAITQLEDDISGLRTIIADLRPAVLDELGLEPALRTLVSRVADSAGIRARAGIDLAGSRLEPDVETVAYRIAQEALTNIVKHAESHTITVDARVDGGRLRLTITDDGRGVGDGVIEGYGIVGMRERATLASGTLEIAPGAGGGTRVTLEVPGWRQRSV
jgi:signal transduction histidine kinase